MNAPFASVPHMKISICWFRRDLRLTDHTALHHALLSGYPVLPLFIFDKGILDSLPADDARVTFIYDTLKELDQELKLAGSGMYCAIGDPMEVWKKLMEKFDIGAVYFNRDYEPYARSRDKDIWHLLSDAKLPVKTFKDQVIFERSEVLKDDGKPYTVFTPYKKKWLSRFDRAAFQPLSTAKGPFFSHKKPFPTLDEIGFDRSDIIVKPYDLSGLPDYTNTRNFPAADKTSYLSPHLRFGTVGIRQVISQLSETDETFLSELIWREFFMQILYHFPHVVDRSFKPQYDFIKWRNDRDEFERWCSGKTGFPIVDAGMRELNSTGYMHNRIRMIVASFLCKDLLIDWRWGEAYFAEKLLDYELSSNNGNWQWAAGTGCDAAPYFRIFNPTTQMQKFDKDLEYVRKWVPEYGTTSYPSPMVDHGEARKRALQVYKEGLN